MTNNMSLEERFSLVKRLTQEIIGEDDLKKLLSEKKQPVVYWGTAPTGKPHVGYLLSAIKIADLLNAGFKVKILLADLHAALDQTPWNVLEHRYDYYEKLIPLVIQAMGANTSELEFVRGSEMQLKPEYIYDVLQLSSLVSIHDANKAGSEVVKVSDNPKLSGLLYPLMQAVDEQYLEADAQLGGVDQRKIMVLARERLPQIGYSARIEIMHPIIPGLIGKKMSSSGSDKAKIGFTDSPDTIRKKIKGADCVVGDVDNGLMAFLQYVLMPLKEDKGDSFVIPRDEKYGGDLMYSSYAAIEKDFTSQKLHPLDLKQGLAEEIILLLSGVQKHAKELLALEEKAYS